MLALVTVVLLAVCFRTDADESAADPADRAAIDTPTLLQESLGFNGQ